MSLVPLLSSSEFLCEPDLSGACLLFAVIEFRRGSHEKKDQFGCIEFVWARSIFVTRISLFFCGGLTRLRGSKFVLRCNFRNIIKHKSVIVN